MCVRKRGDGKRSVLVTGTRTCNIRHRSALLESSATCTLRPFGHNVIPTDIFTRRCTFLADSFEIQRCS